jgi:hypothetical protein
VLIAADGAPLPQTRDRPSADSPGLRWRLERLVSAIAHDDPERALPAFFPRVAYEQVKAVAHPERDWEQRLVRAFAVTSTTITGCSGARPPELGSRSSSSTSRACAGWIRVRRVTGSGIIG